MSEIDWLIPEHRARLEMIRLYHRFLKMSDYRLTKRVFNWDKDLNNRGIVDSWYNQVKLILSETNFQHLYEIGNIFPLKPTIKSIENSLK